MVQKKSTVKKPTPSAAPNQTSLKKQSAKQARTMDELLSQTGYQFVALSRSQIIDGVVTAITPHAVYIDVGAKSEGTVSGKEYDLVKEFVATLSPGDKLKVYVRNPEDDQGNVVLSLRKAATDAVWEKMNKQFQSKGPLDVRGIDTNKGGVIVNAQGLHGFIPSSQLLPEHVGQERSLINAKLSARVIEADRSQNRLVLAERRILDVEDEESYWKAWRKIKVGDKAQGTVVEYLASGVVLDLGDSLEAFLPLTELAWEKVDKIEDFLPDDQPLELKVINKDDNQERVIVSLKQLGGDPWEKIREKFTKGQEVTGRIAKRVAYGFFVELEPGIEGLIHVSKLGGDSQLTVGDEVKCFVENVDSKSRRISLSVVPKEIPVIYK